jgi:hypothetical protein
MRTGVLFLLSVAALPPACGGVIDRQRDGSFSGGDGGIVPVSLDAARDAFDAEIAPGVDASAPDSGISHYPDATTFPQTCASSNCATGIEIDSSAKLEAVLGNLVWNDARPLDGVCLISSDNLDFVQTGLISASKIALPSYCANGGCTGPYINVLTANASCVDQSDGGIGCSSASVTGKVRFRAVVWRRTPGEPRGYLEIVSSCEQQCGPSDFQCANNTCWESGTIYCLYCLAGRNRQCPCFARPEGGVCHFSSELAPDVLCPGECQAGTCYLVGAPDSFCKP